MSVKTKEFSKIRGHGPKIDSTHFLSKTRNCEIHLPFLDVPVKHNQNNSFSTSIHRKKTFTGVYTKWDSFTPRKYKTNLIHTLSYRCIRICSSKTLLPSALDDDQRSLLSCNGYPQGIITNNTNDVLNRHRNRPQDTITTVPKKEVFIVLPHLGLQGKVVAQQLKLVSPGSMVLLASK